MAEGWGAAGAWAPPVQPAAPAWGAPPSTPGHPAHAAFPGFTPSAGPSTAPSLYGTPGGYANNGPGFGGPGFGGLEANPLANLGMQYGKQLVASGVSRYMPGASSFWNALRYYFDVNNSYVKNKLRVRGRAGGGGGGGGRGARYPTHRPAHVPSHRLTHSSRP